VRVCGVCARACACVVCVHVCVCVLRYALFLNLIQRIFGGSEGSLRSAEAKLCVK
jgi:hypothetical protein